MFIDNIQQTVYHARGELHSEWKLWQQYIGGKKSKSTYGANLDCIFHIRNLADLAGLWNRTSYSQISIFFETPNSTEMKK